MKREAALWLGSLGTLVTTVVLAALGFLDAESAAESVGAAVAGLAPLATAAALRGLVWSQESVKDLTSQLGTALGPILGTELTGMVETAAREHGEEFVRAAVTRALDAAAR